MPAALNLDIPVVGEIAFGVSLAIEFYDYSLGSGLRRF